MDRTKDRAGRMNQCTCPEGEYCNKACWNFAIQSDGPWIDIDWYDDDSDC